MASSSDPVEAEARGQEFVEATFSGTTFQVPLDVDSWPLDRLINCRVVNDKDQIVVDGPQLVIALELLLGEQWPQLAILARKKRKLIEASHLFAAAVGIARDEDQAGDVAFGGIPRLLTLLKFSGGKCESDLQHFWGIKYTDRWRFTRAGRRRLTLRKIYVCLSNPPKTGAELAVLDVYEALTGNRHPSRPMAKKEALERDREKAAEEKARAEYRERTKSRQLAGLENARANARLSLKGTAHAQSPAAQP